jgi:hypothetical protein
MTRTDALMMFAIQPRDASTPLLTAMTRTHVPLRPAMLFSDVFINKKFAMMQSCAQKTPATQSLETANLPLTAKFITANAEEDLAKLTANAQLGESLKNSRTNAKRQFVTLIWEHVFLPRMKLVQPNANPLVSQQVLAMNQDVFTMQQITPTNAFTLKRNVTITRTALLILATQKPDVSSNIHLLFNAHQTQSVKRTNNASNGEFNKTFISPAKNHNVTLFWESVKLSHPTKTANWINAENHAKQHTNAKLLNAFKMEKMHTA